MTAPTLGLAEAAKVTGVSESTLRRRRPELIAAGAKQTSKGWQIPVPALIELGLMANSTPATSAPRQGPPVPRQEAVTTPPTQPPTDPLVEALRAQLADAEKRAAVAEAIAQERERIIEVQAQSLRMLTAGTREKVSPTHIEYGHEKPGPDLRQEQPAPASEAPAPAAQEHPLRSWLETAKVRKSLLFRKR